MKNILFVCTGNTCRSCMAEAILKRLLNERKIDDEYSSSSAGIYALEGEHASANAILAMEEMGIDIKNHRARQINFDDINGAYIIFTMTMNHKKIIMSKYPISIGEVFSLKEYADGTEDDIYDPYGGDIDTYRKCALELETYVTKVMDKLIEHDKGAAK
ncbi:MAG TPA: low molecular weight protein arginine phosphatase [Clostridiaceae bacterium]|nr:low molecular weight protein arginine phosphatase [Clostridiaceae bacterium]